MSLEKLKDAARKFEQKEDWRKAIEVYLKAIQQIESGKDPAPDLALYNRVGDLYLRVGDTGAAVRHYERAVDLYADQGFFNNAIALCGKLLRVNPGRTQIYLKLAQLHARKNVVIEAKRNLLEYIERMNAQGELDDAFAAVEGFADQFSGSQDIRLMLVELLRASSRNHQAQEQLDKLCSELESHEDPVEPRTPRGRAAPALEDEGAAARRRRRSDLVFLDTGIDVPTSPPGKSSPAKPPPRPALDAMIPDGLLVSDALPGGDPADGGATGPDAPVSLVEDMSAGGGVDEPFDPAGAVGGFEATVIGEEPAPDGGTLDQPPMLEGLIRDAPPGVGGDGELRIVHDEEPVEFGGARLEGLDDSAFGPGGERLEGLAHEVDLSDTLAASLNEPEPPAATLPKPESIEMDLIEAVPGRAATAPGAGKLAALEQAVVDQPDDPMVHRALAEELLRLGENERAAVELELAASRYEAAEAWQEAGELTMRLVGMESNQIRHLQKLVEFAYRSGNRDRLIEAYLALADALVRLEEPDKAVSVYRRVLDHDSHNARARTALAALAPAPAQEARPSPAPEPVRPPAPEPPRTSAGAAARAPAPESARAAPEPCARPPEPPHPARSDEPVRPAASSRPPAAPAAAPAGEFVDLGSLVLDREESRRDTRMRIEGARPTDDEQKNFEEMLAEFKRGIEQNLEADDYQSHYDLGVAFKEMGLLDEAIAEFQKALRAPDEEGRLRTSEALGVAFCEKEQFGIAETVLRRAVDGVARGDDGKIGLLYWLGRALEAQAKTADALAAYERALAVDIRFMDLRDRVRQLGGKRRS